MKSQLNYVSGMAFESTMRGHVVKIDSSPGVGGGADQGPTPKELLLTSIIGCSAMDVVAILRKNKISFDRFSISGEATPRAEHPRVFTDVQVTFSVDGAEVVPDRVVDAVQLSMTKYCGVSAMVWPVVPIHYAVICNGLEVIRSEARFDDLSVREP